MSNLAHKSEILERPEIFGYLNYYSFLRDYVHWKAQSDSQFSLRKLCASCGLSHSYLSHVLKERRGLRIDLAEKISSELGLSREERDFFMLLIQLSDAREKRARVTAFNKIKRLKGFKNLNSQSLNAHKIISNWYTPAIREMMSLEGFQWDPKWIQSQFNFSVPLAKIKAAMDLLVTQGFVVNEDGRWVQKHQELKCSEGVYQMALGDYHSEMKNLAIEAQDKLSKEERFQLGYTFPLDQDSYFRLCEVLEEAKERVKAIEKEGRPSNTVYHLDLALFPLASKKGGRK